MGVRGEESCAEAGDESVSNTGGRCSVREASRFGATDVRLESDSDSFLSLRTSERSLDSLFSTLISVLNFGDLIAVLAFEVFDLEDSFDSSSSFLSLEDRLDRELRRELRELGLDSVSTSSCTFVIRDGVAFLC